MSIRNLILTTTLAATALVGAPTAALAHGDRGHHHGHRHHHRDTVVIVEERPVYVEERPVYVRERYVEPAPRYYREAPRRDGCRSGGTTGLIVGGAAGALLGREIDGGRDRTTGTVVGGATGALLGREVARNSRC